MTFLDFFSGIGGFRLGLEQAGHTCLGHCEIDKYANKSYQAIHQPKKGEWFNNDITKVRADELPHADVWCFGFPCQDISIAGKQKGVRVGTRSGLFYTVTSLIRELEEEDKPGILFIENVKNLLSINGGWDFAAILFELDEIGYDCQWQVLNSKHFGVAQNRERVFIVGLLRGRCAGEVFPIGGEGKVANEFNGQQANTITTRTGGAESVGTYVVEGEQLQEGQIKQVGNIVKTGNWKDPQRGRIYSIDGICPALNCVGGGGLEPKIAIPVLTPNRPVKRQNGRRFKTNGEPMFTLTSQDRHGVMVIDDTYANRKPRFTKHWPTLRSDRSGLKVMIPEVTKRGYAIAEHGDSINLEQPNSKTRRGRVSKKVAQTIATSPQQATIHHYRIRKLTPRECWRLQGFPDWAFDRAREAGLSDNQLYKQAGNSVTVNVIKAIADKFKEVTN